MNKSELIENLAEALGATKADAGRGLEAFMATVTKVLKAGGSVVMPGFGTFSVGLRSARTGRNPQTGEEIKIKAARVAKFKAGKTLKDSVQED